MALARCAAMTDRDLALTVTADTQRLPGLTRKSWAAGGAAFGAASTAVVGSLAGLLAGAEMGLGTGLLVGASVVGPAMALGAVFGRKWRRWLMRDAGEASVGRWLRRLAVDGGAVAWASATTSLFTLAVAFGDPLTPHGLWAITILGGMCAAAGATLTGLLGFPYVFALARGKRGIGPLLSVGVAAPALLFGTAFGLRLLMMLLGW